MEILEYIIRFEDQDPFPFCNCSVSNIGILRTTENCLVLSPIQFTPLTRSVSAVWTRHYSLLRYRLTALQESRLYEVSADLLPPGHSYNSKLFFEVIFTVWLYLMQRTVLLSQFCPSVRTFVRLSVRRVYCDKTKWRTADIHHTKRKSL